MRLPSYAGWHALSLRRAWGFWSRARSKRSAGRLLRARLFAMRRPLVESLEVRTLLSPGVLDPTFGTGLVPGIVETGFAGGDSGALAVTVQPDEKVIAAGYATTNGASSLGL